MELCCGYISHRRWFGCNHYFRLVGDLRADGTATYAVSIVRDALNESPVLIRTSG
jgi:hypothetical protein